MFLSSFRLVSCLLLLFVVAACVDLEDLTLRSTANVIVVDGTITNLAEPQVIRLNRSKPDPMTGKSSFLALTRASVEVIVDSTQIVAAHETVDGIYQLPSDFRGQVSHAYQLRFTLSDGTRYRSSQQIMQAVPSIDKLSARFNPTSLPAGVFEGNFRSGFDMFIDTQDPINQQNYYRWDWNLFEKQDWCQSCSQGYYMPNKLSLVSSYPNILVYQTQPDLLEDCFAAPTDNLFGGAHEKTPAFSNDYVCRTQCWDIIYGSTLSLFSDAYSNGGRITNRNVCQVPYYTQNPALVNVRQGSLTADAYRYFSLLQQQTQNTGGLADTPPTSLAGNVYNTANKQDKAVGYFTTQAVSTLTYWLDKKDASGIAYGGVYYDPAMQMILPVPGEQQLFYAFHRQLPQSEHLLNFTILGGSSRPPTALCVSSDSRTPVKPVGWQD
jgi:hypothetical protein